MNKGDNMKVKWIGKTDLLSLVHNKVYDVQPLEIISKGTIDNNSLDYHLWLPDVVIQLIDEYYLKDAKAS